MPHPRTQGVLGRRANLATGRRSVNLVGRDFFGIIRRAITPPAPRGDAGSCPVGSGGISRAAGQPLPGRMPRRSPRRSPETLSDQECAGHRCSNWPIHTTPARRSHRTATHALHSTTALLERLRPKRRSRQSWDRLRTRHQQLQPRRVRRRHHARVRSRRSLELAGRRAYRDRRDVRRQSTRPRRRYAM